MKKLVTTFLLIALIMPAIAQENEKETKEMNRIEVCKQNYTSLFGGEALTGQGTDPEFMAILQKLIFGEVFTVGDLDLKTGELKSVGQPVPENNKVRLSKITVDPARLVEYNVYLKEEIEASMRLEPGVLTLYAVAEKEHPNEVTILEIYADEAAYQSHIKTLHFQKYKHGTLDMVQALELIDTTPLIPGLKIK